MIKVFLLFAFGSFVSVATVQACEQEAQVVAEVVAVKNADVGVCNVTIGHILNYRASVDCPLSLDEILVNGINVGADDCMKLINLKVSGIVTQHNESFILK